MRVPREGGGQTLTRVCLQHEADVGVRELRRRAAEFQGVFLNTNVPGLLSDKTPRMLPCDVVTTPAGRRLGLLGAHAHAHAHTRWHVCARVLSNARGCVST